MHLLCAEVENFYLPKKISCLKKPAAETDALTQHTPRSATRMTKQASSVRNCKTKQGFKKAGSVQKSWTDSIMGD